MKFQSSNTHCSKVISKARVFKQWVKFQGQGHMVKNNGTQRKCLITKNTHVKYQSSSTHCYKSYKQELNFHKMGHTPRSRSQGKK